MICHVGKIHTLRTLCFVVFTELVYLAQLLAGYILLINGEGQWQTPDLRLFQVTFIMDAEIGSLSDLEKMHR